VTIDEVMALAPVIPVLVIDDVSHARSLAEALVAGGLRALEVTLRTDCAFDAIAEMARVDGAVVGAGTVLDEAQMSRAAAAGARFLVSPGLTDQLGQAAVESRLPYLPGVATASDVMRGLELGLRRFKFFPAEASGGVSALKALSAPFEGIRFCPTGGVSQNNATSYLALPSVACVGGSWLAPPSETDWKAVTVRARAAAALKQG
jgi:2-dehydro-3-deoxyphosphogluconate aldolase/(4S)-4-hydroxy-2-oxoglutarate aldolase